MAISLVLALFIHALLIVLIGLVDWQSHDFPEPRTVFIDLLDYTSAPPVVEPPVRPVVAPVEPLVEKPPAEVIPPPVEQRPQVQPVEQRTAAPAVVRSPAAAPAATPARPATEFVNEPAVGLVPQNTVDREASRSNSADLFRIDQSSETGTLPAWVEAGEILQPLATLDVADQTNLADKVQSVPGFESLLDNVLRSLASATAATNGNNQSATTGTQPGTSVLPGGTTVEWAGGGSRMPLGTLPLPDLTSSDFGGLVPARIAYVIVFDVNADGLVVPGSLILRNSSGYTAADQKVRRAVSTWRFEPAAGSPAVTAVCTLVLERENVR